MNANQMLQAQSVEINMLRKQNAQLLEARQQRMLLDKLLCAALTGAVSRAVTPDEAAQIAIESAQSVVNRLSGPDETADHEMNQRP